VRGAERSASQWSEGQTLTFFLLIIAREIKPEDMIVDWMNVRKERHMIVTFLAVLRVRSVAKEVLVKRTTLDSLPPVRPIGAGQLSESFRHLGEGKCVRKRPCRHELRLATGSALNVRFH
jgi:hypothetical protein